MYHAHVDEGIGISSEIRNVPPQTTTPVPIGPTYPAATHQHPIHTTTSSTVTAAPPHLIVLRILGCGRMAGIVLCFEDNPYEGGCPRWRVEGPWGW